jgi:hypothetical protein
MVELEGLIQKIPIFMKFDLQSLLWYKNLQHFNKRSIPCAHFLGSSLPRSLSFFCFFDSSGCAGEFDRRRFF